MIDRMEYKMNASMIDRSQQRSNDRSRDEKNVEMFQLSLRILLIVVSIHTRIHISHKTQE